jgi:hypothetical protein
MLLRHSKRWTIVKAIETMLKNRRSAASERLPESR